MDLRYSAEDEAFRAEVRDFLETSLAGEFAVARGGAAPATSWRSSTSAWRGSATSAPTAGPCVGWPKEHGGRGLSLHQQVIYHEEYVRARAPGRVGHVGETLLGPTLIAFGTPRAAAALPARRSWRGEELWCQGYSEPDAGSDLANIKTRASPRRRHRRVGDQRPEGVDVARPVGAVVLRAGPHQPGRAQAQGHLATCSCRWTSPASSCGPSCSSPATASSTRCSSTGPAPPPTDVVGGVDDGWKVAMGTLAFERGVSTLGQNLHFAAELDEILERARGNGRLTDPVVRQRAVAIWIRLQLMRLNALRVMSAGPGHAAGGDDHQAVLGLAAPRHGRAGHGRARRRCHDPHRGASATASRTTRAFQRLFLFSRSDTIYGGSNQVQRNIIGERALGLPEGAQVTAQRSRLRAPGTGCSPARRWSSRPPPAPASGSPPPSGASRRARPS